MYGYYLLIKGINSLAKNEYEILRELLNELLLTLHMKLGIMF